MPDNWGKIRKGDQKAFEHLYDTYVEELLGYGIKISKDRQLVLDSIHDLFLDLYKYRKNLSETTSIKYYLLASLKRKIFRLEKQMTREIQFVPDSPAEDPVDSFEEEIIRSEGNLRQKIFLEKAIDKLTETQKKCIHLRFYEEKSYHEISRILNVSIETSRTIIYRAVKKLRDQLSPDKLQA